MHLYHFIYVNFTIIHPGTTECLKMFDALYDIEYFSINPSARERWAEDIINVYLMLSVERVFASKSIDI